MNLPSTAWHPEFDDVNNDGLIDLFVSKGNIDAQPDYAIEDPSNLLLGRPDGTFAEAADKAGIVTFDRGRGAALVDLNLDGRLDLVESFYGAPVKVWRNNGPVGSNGGTAVPAGRPLAGAPAQAAERQRGWDRRDRRGPRGWDDVPPGAHRRWRPCRG